MTLDEHLEAKFREYFPAMTDFWVGANDADCLTIQFVLDGTDHEYWQTEDNMGSSDADWFVFESQLTNAMLTIPFGVDLED